MPLCHNRPIIAARVLTAHQSTAPEQLTLFAEEQRPAVKDGPAVGIAVLRTDLEALELAAEQLSCLGRAGSGLPR
ncbi:hypothetical protein AQI88_35385 [Streptomyces cellostaticus]|uniref:Uncharacterized protein n=1 Tax=Streptomyces cellostaticus TaxID=67285 RepID=A0A101NEK3_9ACTN|nr:hypothetical protein [Streptomyces cellostaticus]KUM91707.1 hypothetical protein AQI88_35385 [Streptomyces cellostaticus]GHI04176.1 hypothetical protein Scel_24970 [Streptomyces cellostaticus]